MAKKLTNKELMNLTINEELILFGNWIFKHKDSLKLYNEFGIRLPMNEIVEMFRNETGI